MGTSDELERLWQLYTQGALTEEEYERAKQWALSHDPNGVSHPPHSVWFARLLHLFIAGMVLAVILAVGAAVLNQGWLFVVAASVGGVGGLAGVALYVWAARS